MLKRMSAPGVVGGLDWAASAGSEVRLSRATAKTKWRAMDCMVGTPTSVAQSAGGEGEGEP
jgi:hypothetical protein